MGNLFVNLAVPAADGVGAAQATATMGRTKTITVGGGLQGPTLTVEFSHDNVNWIPLSSWTKPGDRTFELACGWMRVRISGFLAGTGMVLTANVDVGSSDAGAQIVQLPVPVGDAAGAAVDVSALGTFNTIGLFGTMTSGTCHIEISEDNVTWNAIEGLNAEGHFNAEFVAQYMRTRTSGQAGGTYVVYVAACDDPPSAAALAAKAIYSPPEKWAQSDVEAAQDATLQCLVSINFDTIKMVRDGSIVGLGTRFTETLTDANADSCLIGVYINGVPGTLQISHNSGANADGGEATQLAGVDTFSAGDTVGIWIQTLASFTPVTTDVEAWIEVQAD